MKIVDVVDTTKEALAQAMATPYDGETKDLAPLSAEELIDIGKKYTADSTNQGAERWSNALISVLAKREIDLPEWKPRLKGLVVESFDWGGFVERAFINLHNFIDDPMLDLVDGKDYSDVEHTFYRPKVSGKIYEEGKGGMIPISISADAAKDAFLSLDALNAYVSKIRESVKATLNAVLEVYSHFLVSAGIVISEKNTETAVHLVTEAINNGILEAGSTAADALHDKAFLTYACKRINDVAEYMTTLTSAFNNGSVPVGCVEAKSVLLHDFVTAVNSYVTASNFKDVVKLPANAETVVKWQGTYSETEVAGENEGDDPIVTAHSFEFSDLSKIMFAADDEEKLGCGDEAITIENAVALLYHPKALGVTLNRIKLTSSYTACADFWNEFLHALVNYIIDTNFSMVAFDLN